MVRSLLIDDIRNIKPMMGETIEVCRTFDKGMVALMGNAWDCLYLDHDLADPDPRKTGYDVLCWLEANPVYLPRFIYLVTQNPVGRQKMSTVLEKLQRQYGVRTGRPSSELIGEKAEKKTPKQ